MAKTTAEEQPKTKTEIDLINQAMADKGISRNSLSDQTRIPYKTLCRRLDGDDLLTFPEFRRIASALDMWPSELAGDDIAKPKQVAA